jgi:hypothetical protein
MCVSMHIKITSYVKRIQFFFQFFIYVSKSELTVLSLPYSIRLVQWLISKNDKYTLRKLTSKLLCKLTLLYRRSLLAVFGAFSLR